MNLIAEWDGRETFGGEIFIHGGSALVGCFAMGTRLRRTCLSWSPRPVWKGSQSFWVRSIFDTRLLNRLAGTAGKAICMINFGSVCGFSPCRYPWATSLRSRIKRTAKVFHREAEERRYILTLSALCILLSCPEECSICCGFGALRKTGTLGRTRNESDASGIHRGG